MSARGLLLAKRLDAPRDKPWPEGTDKTRHCMCCGHRVGITSKAIEAMQETGRDFDVICHTCSKRRPMLY